MSRYTVTRYTVTVSLDGNQILKRSCCGLLAAQVLAASWSVGDFAVAITEEAA